MPMAIDLSSTISAATYARLQILWANRTLPPAQSRLLLEVWTADQPKRVKLADRANALLPLLTSYAIALNHAADLAGEQTGLGGCELLEMAGLPLRFPS